MLSNDITYYYYYPGGDLYILTGQKLSFEAHHVPVGQNKTIKIKPDWKTKHRFAVAPNSSVRHVDGGNKEFSAEYFEASNCGLGDVRIEIKGGELTATLFKNEDQPGEQLRKLGAKVFKDKENFTAKEILGFVLKGEPYNYYILAFHLPFLQGSRL